MLNQRLPCRRWPGLNPVSHSKAWPKIQLWGLLPKRDPHNEPENVSGFGPDLCEERFNKWCAIPVKSCRGLKNDLCLAIVLFVCIVWRFEHYEMCPHLLLWDVYASKTNNMDSVADGSDSTQKQPQQIFYWSGQFLGISKQSEIRFLMKKSKSYC